MSNFLLSFYILELDFEDLMTHHRDGTQREKLACFVVRNDLYFSHKTVLLILSNCNLTDVIRCQTAKDLKRIVDDNLIFLVFILP